MPQQRLDHYAKLWLQYAEGTNFMVQGVECVAQEEAVGGGSDGMTAPDPARPAGGEPTESPPSYESPVAAARGYYLHVGNADPLVRREVRELTH